LTWLIRILLFLLLLRLFFSFIRGLVAGLNEQSRRMPGQQPAQLVRDPICGTFVLPARALPLNRSGETQYFCSERCRQRYLTSAES